MRVLLPVAAKRRLPPDAPVWRMDAFRDRFLTAYGSVRLASTQAASSH